MGSRDLNHKRAARFRREDTELVGFDGLANYFDWNGADVVTFKDAQHAKVFQQLVGNNWSFEDEDASADLDKISSQTIDEDILESAKIAVEFFLGASDEWPEEAKKYTLTLDKIVIDNPIRIKWAYKGNMTNLNIKGFISDEESIEMTWEDKMARRKHQEKTSDEAKDESLMAGNLRHLSSLEKVFPSDEKDERVEGFRREFAVSKIYFVTSDAHILRLRLRGPDNAPKSYERNIYFIRDPEQLEPFFGVAPQPVAPSGPVVTPPPPVPV